MLSTKEVESKMVELRDWLNLIEEAKQASEVLKDELKNHMIESGVDEIVTDTAKATYRDVISNRFNSTAFKKDFLETYKKYTVQTTNKRFTFN